MQSRGSRRSRVQNGPTGDGHHLALLADVHHRAVGYYLLRSLAGLGAGDGLRAEHDRPLRHRCARGVGDGRYSLKLAV